MKRTTSAAGLNLIKKWEGYRGTAYKCPAGVWTIGYGHTAGVTPGMTCSQQQAEEWLKADLRVAENAVNAIGFELTQNEFDALVSFTFNCGVGNLKKLITNRTIPEIGEAILLYNKANGKVLQGLVNRRQEEHEMFLKYVPDDPDSSRPEYYPLYSGASETLDNIFKKIGADADYRQLKDWEKRVPIAEANGIQNYTGTAQQNMKLIELAKTGKLKTAKR